MKEININGAKISEREGTFITLVPKVLLLVGLTTLGTFIQFVEKLL